MRAHLLSCSISNMKVADVPLLIIHGCPTCSSGQSRCIYLLCHFTTMFDYAIHCKWLSVLHSCVARISISCTPTNLALHLHKQELPFEGLNTMLKLLTKTFKPISSTASICKGFMNDISNIYVHLWLCLTAKMTQMLMYSQVGACYIPGV